MRSEQSPMPEAGDEGRRSSPVPQAWWTAIPEPRGLAEDRLAVDDQTTRDLEIFDARGTGYSVHGLLSLTKTAGGAAVLRARMMEPWSSADRIREVQESLRYILAHRPAFNCLPSEVVSHGASEYLYGGLPVETSTHPLAVLINGLTIRWGESRYRILITQGVMRTAKLIHGLRRFLDTSDFPSPMPRGVGALLEEMRGLLSRQAFENVPSVDSWDMPFRRIYVLDRRFRGQEQEALRLLLRLAHRIDAMVAMADAITLYGLVIPEVLEGPATLEAEGLFNLFITDPVPADVRLGQERHMLFVTGPNMAGKSTLLRSLGVAVYLAHLGMGVPAVRFRFTPCRSLFAALNISDDIHGGMSFFRTEAVRMKAVAQAMNAGRRIVALVDEPFKGTNVKDAMDASWLVLEAFAKASDGLFAVSSHLIELGDALQATDRVTCCRFEAVESEEGLTFDYRLRSGISSQRLGMRVLEQEGLVALLRPNEARTGGR